MTATRISRRVNAPRPKVYRALLDPRAVATWMVPTGVRTRLDHVEIRDAGAGDPPGDPIGAAVRLQLDPGGVLHDTRIVRSTSCGVIVFSGGWTDDYADPSFGNSFTEVAGSPLCTFGP